MANPARINITAITMYLNLFFMFIGNQMIPLYISGLINVDKSCRCGQTATAFGDGYGTLLIV
jgi:hypothetical protein